MVVEQVTEDRSGTEKIVAIVQARMSASRLPGKVLLDIAGEPMLARVVERTQRSQAVDQVVVATSEDDSDDPIEIFCSERNYPYFRGNLQDVLDRYYQAARHFSASTIVRITADCPIIDPQLVDQTIAAHFGSGPSIIERDQIYLNKHEHLESNHLSKYDFTANRLPPPWRRTFPIGLDTEVCTFSALESAWKNAHQAHQREHVMPFLYEKNQDFRVLVINHKPDYGSLRLTVDTPQDMELLNLIFEHFSDQDDFSWYEVVDLLESKPELIEINAEIEHKQYDDFEETINS